MVAHKIVSQGHPGAPHQSQGQTGTGQVEGHQKVCGRYFANIIFISQFLVAG